MLDVDDEKMLVGTDIDIVHRKSDLTEPIVSNIPPKAADFTSGTHRSSDPAPFHYSIPEPVFCDNRIKPF